MSNMSNIFKVNNRDTGTTSGTFIVNFEHNSHFNSTVIIVEFEQINAT